MQQVLTPDEDASDVGGDAVDHDAPDRPAQRLARLRIGAAIRHVDPDEVVLDHAQALLAHRPHQRGGAVEPEVASALRDPLREDVGFEDGAVEEGMQRLAVRAGAPRPQRCDEPDGQPLQRPGDLTLVGDVFQGDGAEPLPLTPGTTADEVRRFLDREIAAEGILGVPVRTPPHPPQADEQVRGNRNGPSGVGRDQADPEGEPFSGADFEPSALRDIEHDPVGQQRFLARAVAMRPGERGIERRGWQLVDRDRLREPEHEPNVVERAVLVGRRGRRCLARERGCDGGWVGVPLHYVDLLH